MALFVFVSCTESSNDELSSVKKDKTIKEIKTELNQLSKKINELIGAAGCRTDEQCRVIEFGSRPCGGPASYIAYSTLSSNTALLLDISKEHVKLSKKYNEIQGIISICSVLEIPQVICNKKCEIKENNIMIQ